MNDIDKIKKLKIFSEDRISFIAIYILKNIINNLGILGATTGQFIDTCPVNCIDWVKFEDLDSLRAQLEAKSIRPIGLPPLR